LFSLNSLNYSISIYIPTKDFMLIILHIRSFEYLQTLKQCIPLSYWFLCFKCFGKKGNWIKNNLDECYLYVNEAKTYSDAIEYCLSRDLRAHLPMPILGTSFTELWNDMMAGKYSGFDIDSGTWLFFWLDAQRYMVTSENLISFRYNDPSQTLVKNENHWTSLDTNATDANSGECVLAKPRTSREGEFKLRDKPCRQLHKFFCVIDGTVRTTHGEPTPRLPKFPCYDSESVSRKKRDAFEETIGASKYYILSIFLLVVYLEIIRG
jgi:hypothetical protein